jgi:hypothetical protein
MKGFPMRHLVVLVAISSLLGCSPHVALTTGLIKEYGLSTNDITKLQLFVSDGILMEKHMTKIDKNIDSSSYGLKKVEDYYVKRIYFNTGTPCIATSASPDKVAVAFEQPGSSLEFVARKRSDNTIFVFQPSKKFPHDTIEARESAAGFRNWKLIGEEKYSDTTFNVLVKDELPFILVDRTSLQNFIIESRSVKGLRQSDVYPK